MKNLFSTLAITMMTVSAYSGQAQGQNQSQIQPQTKKLHSHYTSILPKDCVIYSSSELEAEPEIDHLNSECTGLGGYQIFVSGGDLRYPLSLVYNNKEIKLTNYMGFHEVGAEKIEWLFDRTTDGKVTYKALIHRMNFAQVEGKDKSVLIVSKLNKEKSCAVAVVKASKAEPSNDMNVKARLIAEKAQSMSCLKSTTTNF